MIHYQEQFGPQSSHAVGQNEWQLCTSSEPCLAPPLFSTFAAS